MPDATLRDVLRAATSRLTKAGLPSASRDARRLLAHAQKIAPDRLTLILDEPLTTKTAQAFERAITAREAFQPVSQIIGRREFWARSFEVTGDVLDPRPETETLIEVALRGTVPQRLLDLGTGSGVIAITLLCEWPQCLGVAVDLSPAALQIAERNAAKHNVAPRLELLEGDWFAPVSGLFDLIVANPPYIARSEMDDLAPDVRDWEPHLALTPGITGLEAYRAIAAELGAYLRPGGRGLFETGMGQTDAVAEILRDNGLTQIIIHRDMDGRSRIVEVIK